MDNTASGFPPDIQNQLYKAVQEQRARGRSYNQDVENQIPHSRHVGMEGISNASNDYVHRHRPQQRGMIPDGEAFPPLGSTQPSYAQPRWTDGPAVDFPQSQNQHDGQTAARAFFDRARGRGRGRGQARNKPQNQRFAQHDYQTNAPYTNNDYRRPAQVPQQRLYHPQVGAYMGTAEQQRAARQRIMAQSDYLNAVAAVTLKDQLSPTEIDHKHQFRLKLEAVAQRVITEAAIQSDGGHLKHLRLDSYGSLSNSFGTPGCDVDLLMSIRDSNGILLDVDDRFKRAFEGSLLEEGYGARLLTNTRVPILKVCETPSAELSKELCRYRQGQMEVITEEHTSKTSTTVAIRPPDLNADELDLATQALRSFDMDPAELPLPASPVLSTARLEFDSDCGVQADINFTNHIALTNTKLLWTYGQCDTRVRQMGLFVKFWAKARDINTPYHGTLSSYGYILMVLHYLMNVIRPPILPNLQLAAKDGWKNAELDESFEFDTRFVSNPVHVRGILRNMPPNHESLGSLLRGFFNYYSSPQGFNWTQDVISLRTFGGLLTKRAKGWTGAKWSETKQNVRLRYLLAIEDPFELDHNVGRTVGHHGIVAIRNELRRGWQIIEGIQPVAPGSWAWINMDTGENCDGFDLVVKVEDRGDLLRKDADERKQKLRDLREKAEKDEQEALATRSIISTESDPSTNHGTSKGQEQESAAFISEDTISRSLIHDFHHQDDKLSRMRARTGLRTRCEDKDDTSHSRTESLASNDNHEPVLQRQNAEIEDEGETNAVEEEASEASTRETHKPTDTMSDLVWDEWQSTEAGAEAKLDSKDNVTLRAADNSVGNMIAWSKKSAAGRWLSYRDAKIREGSWKPPSMGDHAVLNAKFPYDPSMTPVELSDKNEILERLYTDTLHPRLPKTVPKPTRPSSPPQISSAHDVLPETQLRAESSSRRPAQEPVVSRPVERQVTTAHPIQSDGIIPWTLDCEVGVWLRYRDRQICEGRWQPAGHEDSVFIKLHELFPYDPTMTSEQLEHRNTELVENFSNVRLPWARDDNAEHLLKAILKLLEKRTEKQTSKRATLLGLFSSQQSDIHAGTAFEPRIQDDASSKSRQLLALQRISDSVKPSVAETELERVRRSRLAYYEKQTAGASEAANEGSLQTESEPTVLSDTWIERRQPKGMHHTVEGSWNSDSTKSFQSKGVEKKLSLKHVHFTDYEKYPELSISHTNTFCDTNAVAMPNSDGFIAGGHRPCLWQQGYGGCRYEDPRIIPIPRHRSFQFDARQIADIAIIRAGGNGCARFGEEFSCDIEPLYIKGPLPSTKTWGFVAGEGVNEADNMEIRSIDNYSNLLYLQQLPGILD